MSDIAEIEATPPAVTKGAQVKPSKWRTLFALVVTFLWLLLVAWWTFYRPSGALVIPTLDLNQWGDWAAGAFAPLALLWLAVGYFQQGEELRLQAEELRNSVEQQKELAKAARQQSDILEQSNALALRSQVLQHQPRFGNIKVIERDKATGRTALEIWNLGVSCHDAEVSQHSPTPQGAFAEFPEILGSWNADTSMRIAFDLKDWEQNFIYFEIGYRDELLVSQSQRYYLELPPRGEAGYAKYVRLEGMTFNLPALIEPMPKRRN